MQLAFRSATAGHAGLVSKNPQSEIGNRKSDYSITPDSAAAKQQNSITVAMNHCITTKMQLFETLYEPICNAKNLPSTRRLK